MKVPVPDKVSGYALLFVGNVTLPEESCTVKWPPIVVIMRTTAGSAISTARMVGLLTSPPGPSARAAGVSPAAILIVASRQSRLAIRTRRKKRRDWRAGIADNAGSFLFIVM